MKFAHITTGTYDYLFRIFRRVQTPGKILFMYSEEEALLYQESEGKSIFAAPRSYHIMESSGTLSDKGFCAIHYVAVNVESRPLFERKLMERPKSLEASRGFQALRALRPLKGDLYAILHIWENESAYERWYETGDSLLKIIAGVGWPASLFMNYPTSKFRKCYRIGPKEEEREKEN